MGPKCKRDETTQAIRSFNFDHDNTSDPEDATPDLIQTNTLLRATHHTRGRPNTETSHSTLDDSEVLPPLESIYGALDDEGSSQFTTYGGEEFVAPLEDEVMPDFVEHQVPEHEMQQSTVS